MFVNIINKTNEDVELKNNNLVEDLEKIIDEVFQVRVKAEQVEKKLTEDTFKMQKAITDLEVHVNTSIITNRGKQVAQMRD